MIEYGQLSARLAEFAAEREWDQFHTPKNLAMALAGEVGELLELFQWGSEAEIAAQIAEQGFRRDLSDELADVLIYLVRLADVCKVDLAAAAEGKMESNAERYPIETSRGHSRKAE